MGSAFFLASWAVMMGPMQYRACLFLRQIGPPVLTTLPVQHLLSAPRLPFTAAYFGSIALTLYFAVVVSHLISQR